MAIIKVPTKYKKVSSIGTLLLGKQYASQLVKIDFNKDGTMTLTPEGEATTYTAKPITKIRRNTKHLST